MNSDVASFYASLMKAAACSRSEGLWVAPESRRRMKCFLRRIPGPLKYPCRGFRCDPSRSTRIPQLSFVMLMPLAAVGGHRKCATLPNLFAMRSEQSKEFTMTKHVLPIGDDVLAALVNGISSL